MARTARRNLQAVTNVYPYIRCHVLRHNFEPVGPIAGLRLRPRFGTLVTFRCEHCSTIRLDVVSRLTGDLIYRNYAHPDDYRTDRRSMAEWRVLLMDELDNSLMVDLDTAQ